MTTLLCECESVVNGRPLTYVSDDPNELKPLTPSHFIQDIKGNETVDLDIIDAKHLRKRIRYLQSLRDQLRQRFKEEYLAELVRCQKTSNQKKLAPGDIVLIGSDDKKRLNWPLGRVMELFPGKDNIQRIARVRIANREIIRPVQRIYPLEMNESEVCREVPESSENVTVDSGDKRIFIPELSQKASEQDTFQCSNKRTRYGRRIVPLNRLDL
nr:uncharacterized protein LOC122272539 [Parasteatoda tepidariorum]